MWVTPVNALENTTRNRSLPEFEASHVTLAAVEAHYVDIRGDELLTPLHVDPRIKEHKVNLLLDSGESVNVMNNDLVKEYKLDMEECEVSRGVGFADGK